MSVKLDDLATIDARFFALGPLRSERFLERPRKHAQPFAALDLAPKGENDLLVHGNYYGRRFAEELFNHHAERAGLDWVAQSRGLALGRGAHNVGPISPFALHALREMAITPRGADRFPRAMYSRRFGRRRFHWLRSKKLNMDRSAKTVRKMGASGGLLERA